MNLLGHVDDAERLALHFVQSDGVDQKLRPDDEPQLAEVQFWNQHSLETVEHLAEVRWERIQVPQVSVRYARAAAPAFAGRRGTGAIGPAPGQNQQLALGRAVD